MEERIKIDKYNLGDIICDCFGSQLLVIEVQKYITKVIGWGICINFSYYIANLLLDNYYKIGNIFEEKKSEN